MDKPDYFSHLSDEEWAGMAKARANRERAKAGRSKPNGDGSGPRPFAPIEDEDDDELVLVNGRDVQPRPVRWLWREHLQRGVLNVLAGRPGAGKSTLALAFAATVTTGGLWPDQTAFGDPEYVLFWSGEDPIDDTLIPRFIAAGGERGQIEFISAVRAGTRKRSFDPARDMALLERATSRLRGSIGAIVLDPVVAAVRSDSHKNAETRLSLQPFHDLCAAVGCAGLGIHHLTKRSEGADPIDRVSGSLAFGALPRAVLLAARDMNDETGLRRALLRGKISNGPDMGGYAYQLEVRELDEHPGVMAQSVLWGETLEGSARDILERLEGKAEVEPMDTKAGTFLRAELADGPQMAGEVIKKGEAQGLSAQALRRAFKKFGGQPQKASFGTGWLWELPKQDA
jgi:putative DNA primase/helicase